MQKSVKSILLPLIILWLSVVIVFYYWGHQFSLIPPVIGLARVVAQLVACSLIGLAALGLGRLFSRLLRLEHQSWLEDFVFSLGFGAGILGIAALALGYVGALKPGILWALVLLGAASTAFWLYRSRGRYANRQADRAEGLQRVDYIFLATIAATLFIGLQLALGPPIAWDGLSTHLVIIRDIVEAEALRPSPLLSRPLLGHLLLVWGMALAGDILPQLLSYAMGLLMVLAVWEFSEEHFGRRTAILAVAFLCSVEVFIITAGWPYVDTAVGLFSLLAVLALVKWQLIESAGRSWLIAAALLAALATHTKLNGLFVLPVVAAGIPVGLWWHRARWRERLVDVALALAAGGLLLACLTLAENGLRADSGTDLARVAGSLDSVSTMVANSESLLDHVGAYLTVIWDMTIIGQQGTLQYDGAITPFFLIFIPLLLIIPRKPRVVWAILIAGLLEFAAWLLVPRGYYQNRHLIMTFPLFSILAAYAVSRLPDYDHRRFTLSGFVRVVLAIVFTLQLVSLLVWYQGVNPAAYLLGLQSRDQYLAQYLNRGTSPGYYDMMRAMRDNLPEKSVVGVVRPEPRIYYCRPTCVRFPFRRTSDSETMAQLAREKGLTHVLVSANGLQYYLDFSEGDERESETWRNFVAELDRFTEKYGVVEHAEGESFYLYALQLDRSVSEGQP